MGSGVGKPTAVDHTTRSSTTNSSRTTGTSRSHHSPHHQVNGPSTSTGESGRTLSQSHRPSTSSQQQQTDDAEMVCEACSANFTIFKRKVSYSATDIHQRSQTS